MAGLSRRALLLGVLVSSVAAAAPKSPFTFKIPPGWTDMQADGLQDDVVTTLHPSLAAQLLVQENLVFAVDLNPGAHGQNSFMQAVLIPGKLEVNDTTLPDFKENILKKSKGDEVKATIKSADIVQIGGADVARLVWEVKNDEGDEVRMAYAIPGAEEWAWLIYGCNIGDFAKVRPLMEASAMGTTGAVPQPKFWKYFYKALPYMQVAGVVGILVLLLTGRKKAPLAVPLKKAAPPPPEEDDEGDEGDEGKGPGEKPAVG